MRKPWLFLLPAVVVVAHVPARASTVEYNLSVDQCTGSCSGQTIFGTVTLADTVANTLQVRLSANSPKPFAHSDVPATITSDIEDHPVIVAGNLPVGWSLLSGSAGSLHITGEDNFKNGASLWQPHNIDFSSTGAGLSTSSFTETEDDHFVAEDILNAGGRAPGNNNSVQAAPIISTTNRFDVRIEDTPEPGPFALLGGGLIALGWMLRKKRPNPRYAAGK